MNTLLSLIILLRQSCRADDNNYIISDYIISHMDDIAEISSAKISKCCHVSVSSIIRYCKTLGFKSFSSFKTVLMRTCNIRLLQLEQKIEKTSEEDLLARIASFADPSFNSEQLIREIEHTANMVIRNRSAVLIGAVFPLALSQSFCEDMAVLGIPVGIRQIYYDSDIAPLNNDVSLIISFSGRIMENNHSLFSRICSDSADTVFISHEDHHREIHNQLLFPDPGCSDYDDIIYLLILDLLKYKIYKALHK